jgi:polysaccharide biosynthesis protein PslG
LISWNPYPAALALRVRRVVQAALATALVGASMLGPALSRAENAEQQADPRFFAATGYRIDRDAFWDFFDHRGGIRTFGYPVSREFTFLGCTTQFFQRLIMQQCDNQGVGTLNLLDGGLMPYTRINGSTFPGSDPTITGKSPSPSDPDYATKVVEFVRATAPDTFEDEPVNFFTTFKDTVKLEEAFPAGDGDVNLLPLLNLELWGLPTSAPQRDPSNRNFIYQRFQRGIMHYDKSCGCTQGLLLADYLKALITGENVPADLATQAENSALYRSAADGRAPVGTVYAAAFTPPSASGAPTITPLPVPPAPTDVAVTATSPDYGLSMFVWGHSSTTDRDLKLATSAGFTWQKTLFQWREIEGQCKGCFDWTEADRVVKSSNAAGVKIIARLDFEPLWARADHAHNGPPDNYQDFNNFVSALVSRYKTGSSIGRVHAIEVWNEVNLDREWGGAPINPQQASDYVRLLSGAYKAAKAADPNVAVITAGLSPTGVTNGSSADDVEYLQWLFNAGLKGGVNYDVLGAHGNTQAPEVEVPLNSLPNFPHPSFYFRRIEQLRDVQVRNGDANRQIWLLEFGWTSDTIHPAYSWFAVTEEKKAQNIVKAFQFARQNWSPWIGVMTLWTLPDPNWPQEREELWWAITNTDGTQRPAYTAVRDSRLNGLLQ